MKIESKIITCVKNILKEFGDKYITIEGGTKVDTVIRDLNNFNYKLMSKLFSTPLIYNNYVENIDGVNIFKLNQFIEMFEYKSFWEDSYTRFSNKIGLVSDNKFINESSDVVLDFPYKDTTLKGGMTKEDKSQNNTNESFLNDMIARPEINEMFEPKILINTKKYNENGEHNDFHLSYNDNLVLKGNNLIALHSLKKRYHGKVKMIYIDPPYNTGNDSFEYNDRYNQSSWLVFIKNRLEIAKHLLRDDGILFIQSDDNEQSYLKVLCDEIFGQKNFVANITNVNNLKGNQDQYGFAKTHDYITVYVKNKNKAKFNTLPLSNKELKEQKWYKDEKGYYKKGANLKSSGINAPRNKRPNLYYPIYIDNKMNVSINPMHDNDYVLYPKSNGEDMSWRWQKSKMDNDIEDVIVNKTATGYSLYKKQRPENNIPSKKPKTLFSKSEYSNGSGTNEIKKLFGRKAFSFPKPEQLISDLISIGSNKDDIILDFFMGSATTPAVAMKKHRQFIGVEQMDYINTVSVPRLQKVISGEQGGISTNVNWHGGGSFVYAELMDKNQRYIKEALAANNLDDLNNLFNDMKENADLDFRLNLNKYEKERNSMSFSELQKVLIKMIDKNQLYYNELNIDDASVKNIISDTDYKFNNNFYGKD